MTVPAVPHLAAAHLGDLHPYAHSLVLLIAFGPFVVLGALVVVMRRRDLAAERAAAERAAAERAREQGGQAGPSTSQDAPT